MRARGHIQTNNFPSICMKLCFYLFCSKRKKRRNKTKRSKLKADYLQRSLGKLANTERDTRSHIWFTAIFAT